MCKRSHGEEKRRWALMMRDAEIDLVEVRRPFTFVRVKVKLPVTEEVVYGCGFSGKCNLNDEWDYDRGVEIAHGRALVDLAKVFTWREEQHHKKCDAPPF